LNWGRIGELWRAFNSFMAKRKTRVYWVVERKVTHLGLVNMKTIVISLIINMKFF
jgi:hypothetical protein